MPEIGAQIRRLSDQFKGVREYAARMQRMTEQIRHEYDKHKRSQEYVINTKGGKYSPGADYIRWKSRNYYPKDHE